MTYKQIQKLMGLVQYAPEEEQNELARLLAKAASSKTVRRSINDHALTEKGSINFTTKEINEMPETVKKLLILNNHVIHYRYHRGMYQVRFRRDGYKIEVASKDFDVMKRKFLAALTEQTAHKPSKTPLMKDYLKQWLAEKKPTLKEGTYRGYENLIKLELLPTFGDKHLDRITRKDIQDYLFRIVEQGKNRTAQKLKQLLNAVFSLAVEDYDFKNPMTKIKLPHYEVKKGTPLSKDEERKMLLFCRENPQLQGIHSLLVLLYTGMRVGELSSMQIEENNGYTYISCETGKTRQGYAPVRRRIPISPMFRKVWNEIDFEKAKKTGKKTLDDTIKRIFPTRHLHELRYTFISRCKEAGCNLELVMLWDGHEFDKDVRSSKVDRGCTQYSDEVYFGDIEKVNYSLDA